MLMLLQGIDTAVGHLEEIFRNGNESVMDELELVPFRKQPVASRMHAIDGGSRILFDMPGMVVGTYRTATVSIDGDKMTDELEDLQIVSLKKGEEGVFLEDMGVGSHATGSEGTVSAIGLKRSSCEWDRAKELVKRASSGETVMLDGSLDPITPGMRRKADSILEMARKKGIAMVGLSKKSDMAVKGVPLIPLLEYKYKKNENSGACFSRLPRQSTLFETFGAKFTGGSNFSFRVDVLSENPISVLASMASLCNDAGYPGYPYPLARAHNLAVISSDLSRDVKSELKGRMGSGGSRLFWECLRNDFHRILDGGVP